MNVPQPATVCAAHPSTASAGADVLRAGGNAVDAAVAMVLVSCSAEALFTGLSGGGFATVHDARTGETRCVDFFVAVPGLDGTEPGPTVPIEVSFVGQSVPYAIGAASVAVHGVPAGTRHLWERWGRLDWSDVVAPAIEAAHGTPFPATHAALLPQVAAAMAVGEGARVFCRPDGSFLEGGDLLSHPDGWRGFELLARDPAAFYTGPFADALLAATAGTGAISATDLAAYRVVETEPATVVLDLPGEPMTVSARGDDLDDVLATLATIARTVTDDPLTDGPAALALAQALRRPDRRTETTNVVATDRDGSVCVITTSLGLGAGVWVPGFGAQLNSMLGEGELVRDHQVAGTRMASMMSPLLVQDASGRVVLGAGAAGGSRIRPALVQTVMRILSGADPQAAIDAPRLVATPELVRLEPGFAATVVEHLVAAGEDVRVAESTAPYFGGVSAVSLLGAGADPRRSGSVIRLD